MKLPIPFFGILLSTTLLGCLPGTDTPAPAPSPGAGALSSPVSPDEPEADDGEEEEDDTVPADSTSSSPSASPTPWPSATASPYPAYVPGGAYAPSVGPSVGSNTGLARRYFVEMFLKRGKNTKTNLPTRRLVDHPRFVFENASDLPDLRKSVEELIADSVPKLTGGAFKALFEESAPKGVPVIRVRFVAKLGPRGRTTFPALEKGAIESALIEFDRDRLDDPYLCAYQRKRVFQIAVRHELAHGIGATAHSGLLGNVLSYNTGIPNPSDYADYELEAWQKLYSLPLGTTAQELMQTGWLSAADLDPAPELMSVKRIGSTDSYYLFGNGLNYAFGCNESAFPYPKVFLGGASLEVISFDQAKYANTPGTCQLLRIRVPYGTAAGELRVETGGKSSNEIPFDPE